MLSPSNKSGDGRMEYCTRRNKVLASTTHLIEIDLLRRGARVPMRGQLPVSPYFVFVIRAERRPLTGIWPIQLEARLPEIPVPLLPGDADVTLNLQSALDSMYDAFDYDLELDYAHKPDVPFNAEQSSWASEIFCLAGHAWQG